MAPNEATKGGPSPLARIKLVGFAEGDVRPQMAVYAVDRSFKPLHVARVDSEGNFDLPEEILSAAGFVIIGPQTEKFSELDRISLTQYRAEQFKQILEARAVIDVVKRKWVGWAAVTRCVSGSVSHCYPHPWIIQDLTLQASRYEVSQAQQLQLIDELIAAPQYDPVYKLEVICDGVVEVYRRTCCCAPFIIGDPRTPKIILDLQDIVPRMPPRPRPDPPPLSEIRFLRGSALDERALNARRDLHAIRNLEKAEQIAYIQARPYLFCTCGPAVKVAHGFIQASGEFHICWDEFPHSLPLNCHDEYAFVVKQVINGSIVTIYDGVAANKWFHYGEDANLVSYHPSAVGCRQNYFPGEGAFVLLQDIGDTGSFNLKTPPAKGWDRVFPPLYNDGLVFPAADPSAALGKLQDRNWGGKLLLRYHFSEEMGAPNVDARYYRVSVVASDAIGDPTGVRTYLSDGVTWKKYQYDMFQNLNVVDVNLGPQIVGAESNLFKIPYDADPDTWQSGQYHAELDTTRPEFTNGRYLLTLEVFDSAGQQIKPNIAPPSDPGTDKPSVFRRWFQETGPTAIVAFGALTHMLWWDNRKAEAKIEDLRLNGVPANQQCLFLGGTGTSLFSAGYRAYHPDQPPMFQWYHVMWWKRGLNGPWGYLTSPNYNPNDVGQSGLPGESDSAMFSDMLGSEPQCSFSLNLHVYVKTFDGQHRLHALDDWDQAAFALSV